MFIQVKAEGPFGFAGLYDSWRSERGEQIASCTIITTTPNARMKPIHDRMPVILPPQAYAEWLDPSTDDLEKLVGHLKPYPAAKMKAFQVSPLVNSPKNNSPECIRPVAK
jgi:putative SOS response-associated peptidase YedK